MIQVRTHAIARAAYARVAARRRNPEKNAPEKNVRNEDGPKEDGLNEDGVKEKEYGALAHKLPGMILGNGLAQATGFLLAKGTEAHRALLDDLSAVLHAAGVIGQTGGDALHQRIIQGDLRQTLMLTRRALEASGWIKRYVQGVLHINATGDIESLAGRVDEDN
ncbi:MAG: type III-B CRISPR module-associated protein Cmr5 [Gammaproteobacteria bacterium]|nr:type III-B CRISPR module-associated protein Cmr5 [Gammaproteobacteria bacterium]